MFNRSRYTVTLATGVLLFLGACGSATGPASVAGAYTATTLTSTDVASGTVTDLLAAGSTLTITLANDGTTSGQLFVPAAVNGGTAFSASMVGTFTVANGVVTFTQSADTFIRDLAFTVSGKTLVGRMTFSGTGTTLDVVLARP